jgi:hypothetical protein
MATVFLVSIDTRSAAFGERVDQERNIIQRLLIEIAHEVGSHAPLKGSIKDPNGVEVGTYGFGAGAVNSK